MRLLIIDDKTMGDVSVHGMAPRTYPLYLALAGDIDGDVDAFLAEMAARAPPGLRAIFRAATDSALAPTSSGG